MSFKRQTLSQFVGNVFVLEFPYNTGNLYFRLSEFLFYQKNLYNIYITITDQQNIHAHSFLLYYRPQTKFAKVMFLHVSVCPWGEGEYLGRGSTLDQVHPLRPGTPPGPGTPPRTRYTPPGTRYTPWSSACWEIRATSGRYASYWNAFYLMKG